MTPRISLAAGMLLLVSLGCTLINATPVAWSLTRTVPAGTATDQSEPAATRSRRRTEIQTAAPGPSAAPTETPTPPSTPYLVFLLSDRQTLAVWTPGEAQPSHIAMPAPVYQYGDLAGGVSPTGAMLALRTAQQDGSAMTLLLVSLADGAVTQVSTLVSEKIAAQATPDDPPAPVQAVRQAEVFCWSPDGQSLAFVGAVDGPSADLYVYSLSDGRLRRMTHGTRQAATPSWSPDGKWIFVQEVANFSDNAGWDVVNVWAVAADHAEMRQLYELPGNSLGETVVGWSGADTLVTYSHLSTGERILREVPLSTRWVKELYRGSFEQVAFDPSSRWFVFTTAKEGDPSAGMIPGLYGFDADGSLQVELLQAGYWQGAAWDKDQGTFSASGEQGALLHAPGGEDTLFREEDWAALSPNGLWIAGWVDGQFGRSGGVRLYHANGTLLEEVTADPVQDLVWNTDAQSFYYLSGQTLYQSSFPEMKPAVISGEVLPGSIVLALPGK